MLSSVVAAFPDDCVSAGNLVLPFEDGLIGGDDRSKFVHEDGIETGQDAHQCDTADAAKRV